MNIEHSHPRRTVEPINEAQLQHAYSTLSQYRRPGDQRSVTPVARLILMDLLKDLRQHTTEWHALYGDTTPVPYEEGTYVGISAFSLNQPTDIIDTVSCHALSVWANRQGDNEYYPRHQLFRLLAKQKLNDPSNDFPSTMLALSRSLFQQVTQSPSDREPYVMTQLDTLCSEIHPTKKTLYWLGVIDALDARRFSAMVL